MFFAYDGGPDGDAAPGISSPSYHIQQLERKNLRVCSINSGKQN